MTKFELTRREGWTQAVVIFVLVLVLGMPGIREREWWMLSFLPFAAIVVLMYLNDRARGKPITPKGIAVAAVVSALIGVFWDWTT